MTSPHTPIKLHMVEAMLDDMGVGETGTDEDLKDRAAVKKWCTRQIKELTFDTTVTLGDIEGEALAFWAGYKAGRKGRPKGTLTDRN